MSYRSWSSNQSRIAKQRQGFNHRRLNRRGKESLERYHGEYEQERSKICSEDQKGNAEASSNLRVPQEPKEEHIREHLSLCIASVLL